MPPGGKRLDGAGGDEVDADPARAELAREVARDGLQRGLGDAHPVIGRPGHAGVEVEPDDAGAVGRGVEQRQQPGDERLQRERARLVGGRRRSRSGVSRKLPPSASGGA